MAMNNPNHSNISGLSPVERPTAIIVICTAANRINAPVPALKLTYAKEKVTAYRKSIAAEIQFAGFSEDRSAESGD
jgi:hypothetical protein